MWRRQLNKRAQNEGQSDYIWCKIIREDGARLEKIDQGNVATSPSRTHLSPPILPVVVAHCTNSYCHSTDLSIAIYLIFHHKCTLDRASSAFERMHRAPSAFDACAVLLSAAWLILLPANR